MKVQLTSLKGTWETVTMTIKDTDNEKTIRRLVEDKLKGKEYRTFARKTEGDFQVRTLGR